MLSNNGIVIMPLIARIVAGAVARDILVRHVTRRLVTSVGGAGESAAPAAPSTLHLLTPAVHPVNGMGEGVKRSLLDDIERLTALSDTGALATEEFEKQKERVLWREP